MQMEKFINKIISLINILLNRIRFKKRYRVDNTILYKEINLDREQEIIKRYGKVKPRNKQIAILGRFATSVPVIDDFKAKFSNGMTEVTISKKDKRGLDRFPKPKNRRTWFKVIPLGEEFFITEVIFSSGYSKKWIFECDTIDGVNQLLSKYNEFNEVGLKESNRYYPTPRP